MKLPTFEAALWHALSSLFSWPSLPLNSMPRACIPLCVTVIIIDKLLNFSIPTFHQKSLLLLVALPVAVAVGYSLVTIYVIPE